MIQSLLAMSFHMSHARLQCFLSWMSIKLYLSITRSIFLMHPDTFMIAWNYQAICLNAVISYSFDIHCIICFIFAEHKSTLQLLFFFGFSWSLSDCVFSVGGWPWVICFLIFSEFTELYLYFKKELRVMVIL